MAEMVRVRNPKGEGDRLRDELLDAAVELVAEHGGFDGVSLRAIATRAGVSPTAVYRHFPDADHLLQSALDCCFDGFSEHMGQAFELDDPFERLRRMGELYRSFATDHGGEYRALFSSEWPFEHDDKHGVQAFDMLVEVVAQCLDANGDEREPRFVAYQVWTWVHGIVDLHITHCDMDWPTIEALFDGVVESLDLVPR